MKPRAPLEGDGSGARIPGCNDGAAAEFQNGGAAEAAS